LATLYSKKDWSEKRGALRGFSVGAQRQNILFHL